jgi:hypothetical protein
MKDARQELRVLVETFDRDPVPGFPRFRFGSSAAVAELVAIARDGETRADSELADIAKTPEGRATLATRHRAEAAQRLREAANGHLARLDEQIASAIPEPPAYSPPAHVANLIAADVANLSPDDLARVYLAVDAPTARVLETLPPSIRVRNTVPVVEERLSAETRFQRRLADAPPAARERHEGLTQIRGAIETLAGRAIAALEGKE